MQMAMLWTDAQLAKAREAVELGRGRPPAPPCRAVWRPVVGWGSDVRGGHGDRDVHVPGGRVQAAVLPPDRRDDEHCVTGSVRHRNLPSQYPQSS